MVIIIPIQLGSIIPMQTIDNQVFCIAQVAKNQPHVHFQSYPPKRNQGFTAGLIKSKPMVNQSLLNPLFRFRGLR